MNELKQLHGLSTCMTYCYEEADLVTISAAYQRIVEHSQSN